MTDNGKVTQKPAFQSWRMVAIYVAIAVVFGFFMFRLFSLQVLEGPNYLARADENRTTLISVPTQRGIIFDRNGFVLARNVASYNLTITPASLPGLTGDLDVDNGEITNITGAVQGLYRRLSAMVGIPVSQGKIDDATVKAFKPCDNELGIAQIVYIGDSLAPYDPVRIKCGIDQSVAMQIQEMAADLPGAGIEIEPVRDYPTGSLTSDIIGFLGPITAETEQYYRALGFVPNRDKAGFAGVEMSLNDLLMGKNGERLVEVDVAGKEIRDVEQPVPPEPGKNIRLTIDTRLQTAAQAALVNEMKVWNQIKPEYGLNQGVVIAMNPKTGEILAMVSYPSYENNRFARQIPEYYYNQLLKDPLKPLINHAISDEIPPGSVFKLSASLGILNEGVVTPDYIIDDPGKITIMQKFSKNDPGTPRDYVCYLYKQTGQGHGKVDFLKGLSQSCDVYFYKVGGGYGDEVPNGGLGIWRLGEYAKAIGYNEPTGIELPGESSGLIPDPNWKRINQGESWSTGDTYISTIGQGYVLSTPLQVLVSAATIANDGKMMKPTIVKEVLDSEGNVVQPFKPTQVWDITKDPKIHVFDENNFETGELRTIDPKWVELVKQGMREVVTDGTASAYFQDMTIQSAGKTGTAEYCDDVANKAGLCAFGKWPAHAWYVGYAPYDNPEIAVIAFVYNGQEGSTVASPIVRQVMEAYFELKAIDSSTNPSTP